MAKIIEEGCVTRCGHCNTKFSFEPHEVGASFTRIPAGYSPEEEAFDKATCCVSCPKCRKSVNVDNVVGKDGRAAAIARAEEAKRLDGYYDV